MENNKLFLLSVEEAEKLPIELCQCEAPSQFDGLVDNGYCWWWLRPLCDNSGYAAYVDYDGEIFKRGDHVYYDEYSVRPALHLEPETLKSLKRRYKDGTIHYGTSIEGKPIQWIDVTEYLGKPTLLMKNCLEKPLRFDGYTSDYETSEIKYILDILSKAILPQD